MNSKDNRNSYKCLASKVLEVFCSYMLVSSSKKWDNKIRGEGLQLIFPYKHKRI